MSAYDLQVSAFAPIRADWHERPNLPSWPFAVGRDAYAAGWTGELRWLTQGMIWDDCEYRLRLCGRVESIGDR